MLNKLDIFGSQILLRFKGEQTYNTKFGSFFTLLIVGVISFRLFFIIKDVFQRSSPNVIFNERQVDDPAEFIMNSESFPLAFGMQAPVTYEPYIDETIYTIKAYWQQKVFVYNTTTQVNDSVWEKKTLVLQQCTKENFANLENQQYYLKLNYKNMYCFPPDFSLSIRGDFNSEIYSQVRINVSKCSGTKCKDSDILDKYLQKSVFFVQMSDVYVDPNSKKDPFRRYSRDLFWATSTKLPKDVNIYLRNNYIESDFGWILEDIQTQSFPSYSFYEMSVYPESYQTYFLQVLFRFEKQKESVYQRKYKNFNSIVSEIGGFTQSLLAIGILICTRVSELHLNQEIINQAFNYQDSSSDGNQEQQEENQKNKLTSPKISYLPAINQPIEEDFSQNKIQFLSPRKDESILSPQLNFSANPSNNINNNDNLIQLSAIKKQPDSCNQTLINPSQFHSFQKNSYRNNDNIPIMSDQVLSSNRLGLLPQQNQQQIAGQDQKQILNQLLSDQELANDYPTPQLQHSNDMNLSKSSKVQKMKQKLQEEEFRVKQDQFNNLMEKQTKSMRMSIWEYFKSAVCPFGKLREKKQIINYSIEKLNYNLDIFNIIKRLIEVEKLKRLLLDSDQIKLFDYLPKPTIHQDYVIKQINNKSSKQNEIDLLYQDNRTEIQRARDAFQAYKKITHKNTNTVLDQKIIELLDPNLVAIFEAQNQDYTLNNTVTKQNSPILPKPLNQYAEIQQQQNPDQISQLKEQISALQELTIKLELQLAQKSVSISQEININNNDNNIQNSNDNNNNKTNSKHRNLNDKKIKSDQIQLNHQTNESRLDSTSKSGSQHSENNNKQDEIRLQRQIIEFDNSEIAIEDGQQYPQDQFIPQKAMIYDLDNHIN